MGAGLTTIRINPRYNGPATSANGGYMCGVVARHARTLLSADRVVVSLHRPPPLGVDMSVRRHRDRVRVSTSDGVLIASSRVAQDPVEPLAFVSAAEAEAAAARFTGHRRHPAPHCFVCGTTRSQSDGLGIAPGPLVDTSAVACTWTVPRSRGGTVLPEPLLWAVLDCPGAWTLDHSKVAIPLAEMTISVERRPRAGERLVVVARLDEFDGIVGRAGTTLFDLHADRVASASTTWITPGMTVTNGARRSGPQWNRLRAPLIEC